MRALAPFLSAAAVLALASLTGCASQMRLAPELASAQEIEVHDRLHWSRPMTFGQWQAAAPMKFTARGWKMGTGGGPLPKNAELAVRGERARLNFELSSASSSAVHGDCLAQGRFASLTIERGRTTDETEATLPGFPRLDCEFSGAQNGVMSLRSSFPAQRDSGIAEFGGRRWQIRSVNNLQGQRGSFPIARFGYELMLEERVVAAVDLQRNGRIWMLPGLQPAQQDEVSTLVAALLYFGSLLEVQDA